MKVSFTVRAVNNYRAIKEFITNKWGKRVSHAFEQKTDNFLDLLEKFPEIGSVEENNKQIRGFQLTKQTRVFYRIKNNHIIILSLFDVRQNPNNKFK